MLQASLLGTSTLHAQQLLHPQNGLNVPDPPAGPFIPEWAGLQICPSIAWVDARPRAGNSAVLPETAGYPSASTWLKLHIPHLLPPGVERALYIDCDMITRTSLAPLWAVDLQGGIRAQIVPCASMRMHMMAPGAVPGM